MSCEEGSKRLLMGTQNPAGKSDWWVITRVKLFWLWICCSILWKKEKQQAAASLVDQSSCDAARASLTFTAGSWCSLLNFNNITEHQYHTGLLCNGNRKRVRQLHSLIWIQRKLQHCSGYRNNWISWLIWKRIYSLPIIALPSSLPYFLIRFVMTSNLQLSLFSDSI